MMYLLDETINIRMWKNTYIYPVYKSNAIENSLQNYLFKDTFMLSHKKRRPAAAGRLKVSVSKSGLLHKHHLLDIGKVTSLNTVKINSSTDSVAAVIESVPLYAVPSGRLDPVNQGSDPLPKHIIYC